MNEDTPKYIPKYIKDEAYKRYKRIVNYTDVYFNFYLKAFYAGFKYGKGTTKVFIINNKKTNNIIKDE